ncbi:hypothetical protein FisN_14Lu264 [Fistulifera solaris]|uniref:Vacuolar ATPase assembly integral membrane protein VMA21 homolog n=1 Tax=Fistulifera solaris TaxID=1519565 RepID=A0A1Z5J9U4_FISSO|nr:hypothetical protein FisN_14Lu264 [Fistulifera solaris]|eukprot:GAX10736.1 hypothetical protein FisN_14Lu264 [Fistulifera solaris]
MGFSYLLDPKNRQVGQKLGIATLLMFTLPIITYYVSERYFVDKQHPDNWAALSAIVMTNIIVGGYCYAAYIEDAEEKDAEDKTKGVPPRVGIYKERTD